MQRQMFRRTAIAVLLIATLAFSCTTFAAETQFPDLKGQALIPLGQTTGIKLYAEGAMIIGFAEGSSPAREAGLQVGDVIVAVNGKTITGNADLHQALKGQSGCSVTLTVDRDNSRKTCELVALPDAGTDRARIGAWVRDSMAGIGTVTFVDPESGAFGALGHGICDTETGELMPFDTGGTMRSTVSSVTRGKVGEPGMLNGSYDLTGDSGVILRNTEGGIFGCFTDKSIYEDGRCLPVAKPSEVHTGKAQILSNVTGDQVARYEVEIIKVYQDHGLRDMMIQVTDPVLIEKTGGIVQGMSGSPVIQNGRIVGAVTHVLVNDPTRGYGIFIENMLEAAK